MNLWKSYSKIINLEIIVSCKSAILHFKQLIIPLRRKNLKPVFFKLFLLIAKLKISQ